MSINNNGYLSKREQIKIKSAAMLAGKKFKDVSDLTPYSYDYFIQILNGFKKRPDNFGEIVKGAVKQLKESK